MSKKQDHEIGDLCNRPLPIGSKEPPKYIVHEGMWWKLVDWRWAWHVAQYVAVRPHVPKRPIVPKRRKFKKR